MTDAQLDAMERALERRLAPWLSKAHHLILSEMDDAHAHAGRAITKALKATADGRASARRIDRSPSYQAAVGHMNALLGRLAGPKVDSITGLIRDARAAFYADSVGLWKPHIDPEYRAVPNPEPTAEGERLMRGAIVHGYDLRREIEPAIQSTKDDLFATLNDAGRRLADIGRAEQRLDLWHKQGFERIRAKVSQALSDSDKAVHEATGLLLLAPEYRGDLTNAAGGGGMHLP